MTTSPARTHAHTQVGGIAPSLFFFVGCGLDVGGFAVVLGKGGLVNCVVSKSLWFQIVDLLGAAMVHIQSMLYVV